MKAKNYTWKTLLLVTVCFFTSFSTIAEKDAKLKIKFKDYKVLVNGETYLSNSCKGIMGNPCTYSSADDSKKVFVLVTNEYITKVKKYNSTTKQWVYVDQVKTYFTVRFVDSGVEFYYGNGLKQLIRAMYNDSLIGADGTVDYAKLDMFKTENAIEKPKSIY